MNRFKSHVNPFCVVGFSVAMYLKRTTKELKTETRKEMETIDTMQVKKVEKIIIRNHSKGWEKPRITFIMLVIVTHV